MVTLAMPMSVPLVAWFLRRRRKRRLMVQQDFDDAVSVLHWLETDGPSTAAEVAAGVGGLTAFRAMQVLEHLVTAGGATVEAGTYTRVEP
jgi:hypothetical protein